MIAGGSPGTDENACNVLVRFDHWSDPTKGIKRWTINLPLNDKSYTPATPQQAKIAESQHNWAPTVEQEQFRRANEGPFQERQYPLRVKSQGPVRAFIVPCFKGQGPAEVAVSTDGDTVVVTAGGKCVRFAPDGRTIE